MKTLIAVFVIVELVQHPGDHVLYTVATANRSFEASVAMSTAVLLHLTPLVQLGLRAEMRRDGEVALSEQPLVLVQSIVSLCRYALQTS